MDAEGQLQDFIARFTPEIAALTEASLAKMRRAFPRAWQLVYDNYNALVIGFGPSERASDAIFSIAVYPSRVSLCLLKAGKSDLNDPARLLQGSGTLNRFIPLASAATLDEPAVQDLIAQANVTAPSPLNEAVAGRLIIKSVSVKQRPRRPAPRV
jgi:hypothetical protein